MNKRLLVLVGFDIVANFCVYLLFEDYEALLVCLFKCIGAHGVITGDLITIIVNVFLSCIITITRTIQFLDVFSMYILCLNIYSTVVCFMLLNNTCHDEMVNTELGFKNNCILK